MFTNGERFDNALEMDNSQQVKDIINTINGEYDKLLRIRYDARPNSVRRFK